MATKSGKVQIISQVLLKSANMSNRKDFLSNIVQVSDNNISLIRKPELSSTNSKKQRRKELPSGSKGEVHGILEDDQSSDQRNILKKRKRSASVDKEEESVNEPTEDQTNRNRSNISDSESDSNSDSGMQNSNNLLDSFAKDGQYELIKNNDEAQLNSLNDNEEIYFLRISKFFDPRSLLNIELPFDTSTKLKSKSGVYSWNVDRESKQHLTVLNFDKLLHVETAGTITLERQYQPCHSNVQYSSINDIPEYPQNLKKRHPLFGAKYKKKLRLSDNILDRLENKDRDATMKRKKKKDKTAVNNSETDSNVNILLSQIFDGDFKPEDVKIESDEKRKRKSKEKTSKL